MGNFNDIFGKDVPFNNIKSHKEPGFHPHFTRYTFRNTTGDQIDPPPPAVLGLTMYILCNTST